MLACVSSSDPIDQANLRVSNLTLPTKAADLKQHFSAHGKVISAKILASTRTPGGCVGFLMMATAEDAASCILNLDGTEFNGNIIKIEATDKMPPVAKPPKSGHGPTKNNVPRPPMAMLRKHRPIPGMYALRTV